ncbi:MAG: hypothetical protein OHK0045_03930 [Raineya sp.]
MLKKSILLVFFVGLLLGACSKNEEQKTDNGKKDGGQLENKEKVETAPANKFVGSWEIIEAQGDMAELNKGVIYTFTNDEMSTSMAKGKYSLSGDTLIVNFEGLQQPFKYIVGWDGEKMKLDLLSSGGQKFVLEKK